MKANGATPIELQSIIDAHDNAFVLIDEDYTIIAANKAYSDAYDVDQTEIVGSKCHNPLPMPMANISAISSRKSQCAAALNADCLRYSISVTMPAMINARLVTALSGSSHNPGRVRSQ